jgi:ABC-type oligopeptide transport system substrate-binding subunit
MKRSKSFVLSTFILGSLLLTGCSNNETSKSTNKPEEFYFIVVLEKTELE